MIPKDAPAGEGLQNRGARLFDLQKKGILILSHQQEHEAEGGNAADPDHLDGQIMELESVKEAGSFIRQCTTVLLEGLSDERAVAVVLTPVIDCRTVLPDRRKPRFLVRQLGKIM